MLKIFLIFFFFSFNSWSIDTTGLATYLAGDMVYDQGFNDTSTAQEKLTMRGAELSFFAPIDHQFDGVLSAAAHDENGETVFELHELHISTSKIAPGLNLKAGQFFLGIGRLNQIHQHDWPFIKAPKVHESFFDSEGVFDSGLEGTYVLPTDNYLGITVGLTSGYRYGHAHTTGSKPKVPTHYLRLATFQSGDSLSGIQYGLNYLGRTDEQKNDFKIVGLDLTAKKRTGKNVEFLSQMETWYKNTENAAGTHSEQIGMYWFNQTTVTDLSALGLRLDLYKDLSKTNSLTGKKQNNIEYGIVPEWTYKSSEFATFRLGLSHTFTREEGITSQKDTRLSAQMVFILGAHPAHDF